MKHILTQIQSICCFLLERIQCLPSIRKRLLALFLMPSAPYGQDLNARIKVLTRGITIYKSELPNKNRSSGPMPKYLQISQFIGQDLLALECCFPNQKEFVDYTQQMFNWNHTMCHLYIAYYRFLIDYTVFVYSSLPWTTIRNECTLMP